MNGTSLFLKLEDKNVLILGSGEVGIRRAKRFQSAGANVVIFGEKLPKELKTENVKFHLGLNKEEIKKSIEWANLVVVATTNTEINEYASKLSENKLLNRADIPEKGNLIVPTKVNLEDIEISIYTGGKSPLMAKILRKKLEKLIAEEKLLTKEELTQIKLQDYCRKILKNTILSQRKRKEVLENILVNERINDLLSKDKLNEAKVNARDIIMENANDN
ncbi:precorrin-2 dehydrogenase/sirohydrochlorin ferrochelatase family protein [Methanobrevibacter curvatus]|uniref:precorrin-2 dehydrogenase n=1 Tax=Methanobrevibacter curvatus TaxID=49547 RepID=A0A166BVI2_9EURY|nr:bifunctional precorrin-2 dehydrogenase/sirohydrochlorin ferrochelatase [Methanobrevibacter curvatus]KZX13856.1 siroheme synthase [Methanobrevibacter curvatus]